MNDNHQDNVIGRISSALGHSAPSTGERVNPFVSSDEKEKRLLLEHIASRTEQEREVLLKQLITEGEPLKLVVIPVPDNARAGEKITEIVKEKSPEWGSEKNVCAWKHPLVEALELPERLKQENIPVYYIEPDKGESPTEAVKKRLRKQVESSFIGITSADYCLSDTASLVMRARPGEARGVSLVPSIHIAVIEIDRILANLKELHALLKWSPEEKIHGLTNCMTFISGPSKTADIEATMVHGAHGPRELFLFVITARPGNTPP